MKALSVLEEVARDQFLYSPLDKKAKNKLERFIRSAQETDPFSVGQSKVAKKLNDAQRPSVPDARKAEIEEYLANLSKKQITELGKHHKRYIISIAKLLLIAPPVWSEMNVIAPY